MSRFLVHRLLQAALLVAMMSFVCYALIGLMPGDPIDLMLSSDPRLTPEDAIRLKAIHGLDRPIVERYLAWLAKALSGEFGYSRLYAQPASAVLGPRLANTALLMGVSLTMAALIALPIAVAAAARAGSGFDRAVNALCFAGISVPTFWLALVLIMIFAVQLGWLPAAGLPMARDPSLVERGRHLILPLATLTLAAIGGHVRYVRAAMIEALGQDYIRTAHAKGLHPRRVLWRHALRNALLPYVTVLALDCGALVSGALITETMFGYPGMGKLIFDAVMGNDYNLALLALLLVTALTVFCNLLADLAYAALDPRIRQG
ncbi:peptide/nickel transport system permease protein [Stella humosa]|uniref:Peptide/nickel transport system permease protein n=1 Tax=Stella humosa TaxID=94 RepID=A0A3N1KX99_9PROT|nr:ABC transporter permease [Stella humosa]ROP83389.1 peptide/nickel transport system permease protein [Stella humosa]BBK29827.1 peptide ABC transporter permease [Stella humosa]